MIRLTELLHIARSHRNEEELTPIDNWKATDAMFIEYMGFRNDGMYSYSLKKPKMRLVHKRGTGFVLEDKDKNEIKVFPTFKELEEYFANYRQEWENQPYL